MKIELNSVVTISYTISNILGEVIKCSKDAGNYIFRQGAGSVMKGIEDRVLNRDVGYKFKGLLSAENAFGEYKADHVIPYHISHFKHLESLEVGQIIKFQIEDCKSQVMKIIEISGETVIADANHELAGLDILLEFEILKVTSPVDGFEYTGCHNCKH